MFHSADVDGSGYLDAAELAAVLDKKVRRPICNALLSNVLAWASKSHVECTLKAHAECTLKPRWRRCSTIRSASG